MKQSLDYNLVLLDINENQVVYDMKDSCTPSHILKIISIKNTKRENISKFSSIISSISSKHVLPVKGMYIISDSITLRTKYCENGSIEELFQSVLCNDIYDCVLLYLSQICGEVRKFHELNIPIINIKPSNVVYDSDFNLYLCDYCQYLLYSDIRQIPLSKIRFFSPEVLVGKEMNIKSDIWSFGILFYYFVHPHHEILITKRSIMEIYREMISLTKQKEFKYLDEERNKFLCNCLCRNAGERYTITDIINNIYNENRNSKTVDSTMDSESFISFLNDRNNIDIVTNQLQNIYKVNEKRFNSLFESLIDCYNNNNNPFSILILIINLCLWRPSLSFIVINKIPEDVVFMTPLILLHDIKELYTLKIDNYPMGIRYDEISECLTYLSNLDSIILHSCFSSNSLACYRGFCLVYNVNHLVHLILSNCYLSDNDIKLIDIVAKRNPHLIELDLQYNSLGKKGAEYLSILLKHTPKLEILNLNFNNILNDGLWMISKSLKYVSNLKCLELELNSLYSKGLECLCSNLCYITNLRKLNLSENSLYCEGIEILSMNLTSIPRLYSLNLSYTYMQSKGMKILSNYLSVLTNLSELQLYRDYLYSDGLRSLCKCFKYITNLINLNLSYNGLSLNDLSILKMYIANLKLLKVLDISNNGIEKIGTKFTDFKTVYFGNIIL